MVWQTKLGTSIVQSLTEKLGVSCHGQSAEPGLLNSIPDVEVHLGNFGEINLEHLCCVWSILSELLIGSGSPRAHNHRSVVHLLTCSGRSTFSFRVCHSLESSGGHADGRLDRLAHDVGVHALPLGGVHEGALLQLDVLERVVLLPEGNFVVRARVEVVVRVTEETGVRYLLVVGDLVETFVVL